VVSRDLLIATLCAVACSSDKPTKPSGGNVNQPQPAPTLVLVATPIGGHDIAGRAVLIHVALHNRGSAPVTVNRRMLVNYPSAPQVELALDVESDGGTKHDFQAKIRVGDPSDDDFVSLAPGDRLVERVDLGDSYGVVAPGKYTVKARYGNKDKRGWMGGVVADPIVVDVIAPPPIGDVEMLADGTLKMLFRHPWSTKNIAPGDPEHAKTLAHVGPMTPGDKKLIPPWPDDVDDSRAARALAHHLETVVGWKADEWNHEILGIAEDGSLHVQVTFLADSGKSRSFAIARPAYTVK
jgi:hypothetical protein